MELGTTKIAIFMKFLFEDGNTEEWSQDEYDKNSSSACIPIDNIIFRFTKKFFSPVSVLGNVTKLQGGGIPVLVGDCYSLRLCHLSICTSSLPPLLL